MQVHKWRDMPWEEVTPELSRRFITGTNEMIAQVFLRKGTVVAEHAHASEQITYILEGALQFWIGEEQFVVGAGEVLVIPPNIPHKAAALEDTLDVDIFSPIRQDWIDKTDSYLRRNDEKAGTGTAESTG
jgi:quercetin dioxygenase-like cupin family protein